MYNLFVYGTLRKNECFDSYLKNSEFIAIDSVKGFIMLDFGDYPMIFESGADNIIIVEIYEIDGYILEQIDRLEEYYGDCNPANLYQRKTVQSVSGLSGFIYTGKNEDRLNCLNLIESGDWLRKTQK